MGLRLLAPKSSAVRLLGHDSNIGGGGGGHRLVEHHAEAEGLGEPADLLQGVGDQPFITLDIGCQPVLLARQTCSRSGSAASFSSAFRDLGTCSTPRVQLFAEHWHLPPRQPRQRSRPSRACSKSHGLSSNAPRS